MCKLLFTFKVFSGFYRSFIRNKTFTNTVLRSGFQKLPGSFEINTVRQYPVNFSGLADIVNSAVYKTEQISTGLGHGKLTQFWTLCKCHPQDASQSLGTLRTNFIIGTRIKQHFIKFDISLDDIMENITCCLSSYTTLQVYYTICKYLPKNMIRACSDAGNTSTINTCAFVRQIKQCL